MKYILRFWDKIALVLLLLTMFVTMFLSSKGDSAIVDEIAHIPSGYSYLTTGEYRLNPEHPPLIKDIAALPLVLSGFKFPYDYFRANAGVVNNQWQMGWKFIYETGNDPEIILLYSRIPMMLLSLLLGYLIFRWASELYGKKAGLFGAFLFVFDSNIIAHSRFVTTDLGISLALFLNLYALYVFIKRPSKKSLIFAGATFGIALLTKFSAGILAPIYLIIFAMALVGGGGKVKGTFSALSAKEFSRRFKGLFLSFGAITMIGLACMWVFYFPHTMNLSSENQKRLISESLSDVPATDFLKSMSDNVLLRPLVQYTLGFAMVSGHVEGGHDAFLMGQNSNKGWWYYYPVTIMLKTAIPLFFLLILTICFWEHLKKRDWFTEVYLWILPVTLLGIGMMGSINLGIRYMLPIFPFIFLFISRLANMIEFGNIRKKFVNSIPALIIVGLLTWYMLESLLTFPHYLSYFNQFAGGNQNGYKYLTDSNTDWGQDVRRLTEYVEKNKIDKIYVDVFPGTMPAKYYLEGKMIEWHVQNGRPKGLFALSATFYQGSRLKRVQNGGIDYSWLDKTKPKDIIGGSILIYDLR